MVHIDFGFIFGEDPKPWVPPMKICKEMIQCMGGDSDPHYLDFQRKVIMVTTHSSFLWNKTSFLNILNIFYTI